MLLIFCVFVVDWAFFLPSVTLIDSTQTVSLKWWDGVAVGTKVYFTPYTNDNICLIETLTDAVTLIPSTQTGNDKWWGGVAVGTKVYFGPYSNNNILLIETLTDTVTVIPSLRWGSRPDLRVGSGASSCSRQGRHPLLPGGTSGCWVGPNEVVPPTHPLPLVAATVRGGGKAGRACCSPAWPLTRP